MTPSADNVTHLLLGLDPVDFAVDERGVNLDWDCAGCFGHPWSHEKFCKTVDSPVGVDLFKGFQILGIVYILEWELCEQHHARLGRMLQMEGCSHRILKARTAKLWELGSGSLGALQSFVASHSAWFRDVVIMDGSYINAAFDNRRLAGQHGGGLVTGEVQTQLRKDEQGSEDEQRSEETGVKEANETEDEQRGEETGVEKANESDEPSESSDESDEPSESIRSDRSFVPTV